MPLLQVRDFPESLYRSLERRAKEERRSISQQTIVLLSNELGTVSTNQERRKGVLAALDKIHAQIPQGVDEMSDPITFVREDRER